MDYIRVKNWDRFQQYKDRDPKWIKLYRDILDNYEYSHLPDTAKSHLTGIWLLAAKLGNKIPADPVWLAKRINATTKIDLKLLERAGFIELYSSVQNCTDAYSDPGGSVLRDREEKRREETEKKRIFTQEFHEKFWPEYPTKTNKQKALEKFLIARRDTDLNLILDGLKRYIEHVEKKRRNGFESLQWRGPAVFLLNRNWEDDYTEKEKPERVSKIPD